MIIMGHMFGWGYGMNGGWFGMFIPIILIGIIVYAIYKITSNNTTSRENGNRSLEILNERYAKGEISEEEYIQKKKIMKDK